MREFKAQLLLPEATTLGRIPACRPHIHPGILLPVSTNNPHITKYEVAPSLARLVADNLHSKMAGKHPIHIHPARPLYRFAATGLSASMWFFVRVRLRLCTYDNANDDMQLMYRAKQDGIRLSLVQNWRRELTHYRSGAHGMEAPVGSLNKSNMKGRKALQQGVWSLVLQYYNKHVAARRARDELCHNCTNEEIHELISVCPLVTLQNV